MYHHRKFPGNDKGFHVSKAGKTKNREKALANMPKKSGFTRDEKPPNGLARPRGDKSVTTRYVSTEESDREWHLMRSATGRARTRQLKVKLHANPGPDYNGRGDKSLSRPGTPNTSPRQPQPPNHPQNAGPSRQRAKNPGPAR